MAIKKYKPTTPGRRGMSSLSFEEITSTSPERSLLEPLSKKGRPQQHRSDHNPSSGRRTQASVPRDRLQA